MGTTWDAPGSSLTSLSNRGSPLANPAIQSGSRSQPFTNRRRSPFHSRSLVLSPVSPPVALEAEVALTTRTAAMTATAVPPQRRYGQERCHNDFSRFAIRGSSICAVAYIVQRLCPSSLACRSG
eukprot:scaffold14029_cov121-Isochrysis_galbana.AAC.9